MNRRLSVNPQADRDIDVASLYIAQTSEERALRFLDAVAQTFRQLAEMPGLGNRQQFRSPRLQGLRRWHVQLFPAYLIFYRATEEEVEVVRVLHGARDIQAEMEEAPPDEKP